MYKWFYNKGIRSLPVRRFLIMTLSKLPGIGEKTKPILKGRIQKTGDRIQKKKYV